MSDVPKTGGGRGQELGTQMGCSPTVKSIPAAAQLEDRRGPHDWHDLECRGGRHPRPY